MDPVSDTWNPNSWNDFRAAQQPDWPDPGALEAVLKELSGLPPLVFAGEARALTAQLGPRRQGRGLPAAGRRLRRVLRRHERRHHPRQAQGHPPDGRRAHVLRRRAGGEGRPHRRSVRQAPLHRHRDDRRHRAAVVPRSPRQRHQRSARRPGPPIRSRLLQAYNQSASTLNLLRAFTKGGFADVRRVHAWNQEFIASSTEGHRYDQLASGIDSALRFVEAAGFATSEDSPTARGRSVHQPRGPGPRLRGSADPARLDHRRLVRLLGPHAVDRRAHSTTRRCPRRVPARRRESHRLQARTHRHSRRCARRCARP